MLDSLVTPWTVARQALVSMGFPRQKYLSELPFISPGDLSNSGIEPTDPLENKMPTHFSVLAWEIPWTEEPGGLQSMGSPKSPTQVKTHWNPSQMPEHKNLDNSSSVNGLRAIIQILHVQSLIEGLLQDQEVHASLSSLY